MWQRARVDNLTVCYRKKHMDISFSCVCPVIDNVITKFMISNRTDKRKTDINLLNMSLKIILHVKIIQT